MYIDFRQADRMHRERKKRIIFIIALSVIILGILFFYFIFALCRDYIDGQSKELDENCLYISGLIDTFKRDYNIDRYYTVSLENDNNDWLSLQLKYEIENGIPVKNPLTEREGVIIWSDVNIMAGKANFRQAVLISDDDKLSYENADNMNKDFVSKNLAGVITVFMNVDGNGDIQIYYFDQNGQKSKLCLVS